MILITLKHILKTQTVLYLFFIELNSCCHPLSTLVRNLGLFSATSRLCQACNFRLVGSVLSITISLMLLSRFSYVLSFCFISIIVIHPSLAATRSWTVNFKTMLPTSSVVLTYLTTYLRSFELCTGFLSNPVFCAKFFLLLTFLSLNNSAPSYLSYISHAAVCSVSPTPLVCRHSTPSSSVCSPQVLWPTWLLPPSTILLWNNLLYRVFCPGILPVTVDWAIKTNVRSLILYTLSTLLLVWCISGSR